MSDTWLENAEDEILFSNAGGSHEAEKLLEIGPVNRTIIDDNQAYGLIVLRVAARYFRKVRPAVIDSKTMEIVREPYKYLDDYADIVEAYQQTMIGETNSRIQFMKVAIETAQGLLANAKRTMGHMFQP